MCHRKAVLQPANRICYNEDKAFRRESEKIYPTWIFREKIYFFPTYIFTGFRSSLALRAFVISTKYQ